MELQKKQKLVIVRGGGDIATGSIWALWQAGYAVLVLEIARPSAIRRTVALSEAVYAGTAQVEDLHCVLAKDAEEAFALLRAGKLAMLVDPKAAVLERFRGTAQDQDFQLVALVDAILAKKNLGTDMDMAPFVVALGPGFTAGKDCHAVIETMRGHKLGRIIREGSAMENTGVPGLIAGHADDRVLHASHAGVLHQRAEIADMVEAEQVIADITDDAGVVHPVRAGFSGLLRGLIRDGFYVPLGFKIADIDPRAAEYENCFTISDKARCIGGAVLTAIVGHERKAE